MTCVTSQREATGLEWWSCSKSVN